MYVSPAVRSIREHPVPGEEVTLLLTVADDADVTAVAGAVAERGGTVTDRLAFGTLAVAVAHDSVAAVCALDGIEAVETDDTLGVTLDGAGEDVDLSKGE